MASQTNTLTEGPLAKQIFLVLCNVVVVFRVDIGLPVLDTKGVAVQEQVAIFSDAAR